MDSSDSAVKVAMTYLGRTTKAHSMLRDVIAGAGLGFDPLPSRRCVPFVPSDRAAFLLDNVSLVSDMDEVMRLRLRHVRLPLARKAPVSVESVSEGGVAEAG